MVILNTVITIAIGLVSYLLFIILFYGLNRSVLRLFVPVQKLTSKLKRKKQYESTLYYLIIFICVLLRAFYKFGNIEFGVLAGFLLALNSTIFNVGIGSSEENQNL